MLVIVIFSWEIRHSAVINRAKFCKLPQPVITLEIMAARQNSHQESIGAGFKKNYGVLHNNHG